MNKMHGQGKKMLMWCGVSFFMILISFFWIMNLKYTFKVTAQEREKNNSSQDFQKAKQDFSKTFGEIKKGFSEIKQIIKETNVIPAENQAQLIYEEKNI